ncbi:MAG: hypothetical protein AAFX05_12940, partial [Planctomycetota bacterium]
MHVLRTASIAVVAALTWLGSPAHAGDPPAWEAFAKTDLTSDANAALRYWRAWTFLQEDERAWLQAIDSSTLADGDFALDDEGLARLAAEGDTLTMLIEAATMERCDFGIDYHKGPGALIPHLSAMRLSAFLLAVDARVAFDNGETAKAATSLAAGYALAEHCTQDRVLISALVGMSIFQLIDDVVQYAEDINALDEASRRTLCAALDRFDDEDPFRVLRSIEMEGRMMSDWWMATARRADFDLLAGTLDGAAAGNTVESLVGPMRRATRADVDAIAAAQVEPFRTYYESVEQAWNQEDAPRQ